MPGYDWKDSSGNVDASQSGYDYSSGTSYGNSNDNSSNNSSDNSNNYYSNPDDNYDDSWESQSNDYEEPYTPPNQIYGSGQAGPGESYEYTHEYGMSGPNINSLIQGLSPQTLAFWGINANSQTIPNELFQMLIEGSIVGDNEDMYNDIDPNTPGIQTDPGVGTFSDLEMGNHPAIGGMDNYYNFMSLPTLVPYANTSSGSGDSGYGYGYGYGNRGRSGGISGRAAQPTIDPYNPEFGRWGQSTVQGDFIRSQRANRGGIISLRR